MNNAIDVARYIINYTNSNGGRITNLKLQKILYFVQGVYLVLKNCPCFLDDIEAWDFGPVVPTVYREFKEYGSNSIPSIEKIFKLDPNNIFNSKLIQYDDSVLSDEVKKIVKEVVVIFWDTSASALVTLTHEQDPWITSYKKGCTHSVIPIEEIKKYFMETYVYE